LALDDLQGRIVRGESIDVNRMLTAAEALAKLLPAAVLASPPPEHRADPRRIMFDNYMAMRRRGEQFGQGYDGLKLENERLRAELAALKAAGAPAPDEPSDDIPVVVARVPAPAGNVVPLSRPPATSAPAPAAPQYDYSKEQGWKDYVEPTGEIRSTQRGPGRYWGPV
jgi:hypothetical protein